MDTKNTIIQKNIYFLITNSLLISYKKENNKGLFNKTSLIPSSELTIGNSKYIIKIFEELKNIVVNRGIFIIID